MTKTVYQTDNNGVFIGDTEAHENPLELGFYLIPAGCVEVAPPKLEAGKVNVWSGIAWELVPDHRGEVWFTGKNPTTIDFVGDPTERGYSLVAPASTLGDLRAAKIAAINVTAAALFTAGAPIDSGLRIALDANSRSDLSIMAATATAASAGAVSWPDSYSRGWIAIENVRIPLPTPAAGLALACSVGTYYAALIQHRRDLKDAALTAEDAAALDAIDVAAGWPAS